MWSDWSDHDRLYGSDPFSDFCGFGRYFTGRTPSPEDESSSSNEEDEEPESDIAVQERQARLAKMLAEMAKHPSCSPEAREARCAKLREVSKACKAAECPKDRCYNLAVLIVMDFHISRSCCGETVTNSEGIDDTYDECLRIETERQLHSGHPTSVKPEHLAVKRQVENVRWQLWKTDQALQDRKIMYEQKLHEAQQQLRDHRIRQLMWVRNENSEREEGEPDMRAVDLEAEIGRYKQWIARLEDEIALKTADQLAKIRGERPIYTLRA